MIKVGSGSFGDGYDNYSLFYSIAKVLTGSYGMRIIYKIQLQNNLLNKFAKIKPYESENLDYQEK